MTKKQRLTRQNMRLAEIQAHVQKISRPTSAQVRAWATPPSSLIHQRLTLNASVALAMERALKG